MSLPKPYYEEAGITIYHGDCREILPLLPKVDLVLTDPPYGVDIAEWDAEVPYALLNDFLGLAVTVIWFGAASRILADGAAFPAKPERILIWQPAFSLSKTMAHGMAYRWHPIFAWGLPKEHEGPTWDVLRDSTECGNWWNHPCTKPLRLIKSLAQIAPPAGSILDPFMGSGTTLVAAKQLGRRAIGIELEEKYCAIAVERLRQAVLQFDEPAPVATQASLLGETA